MITFRRLQTYYACYGGKLCAFQRTKMLSFYLRAVPIQIKICHFIIVGKSTKTRNDANKSLCTKKKLFLMEFTNKENYEIHYDSPRSC